MSEADIQVTLKSLMQVMVDELVDDSEAVEVRWDDVDGHGVLSVGVGAGEIGKLIGKQGRMARSLRTVFGAACRKHGVRCDLNIVGERKEQHA